MYINGQPARARFENAEGVERSGFESTTKSWPTGFARSTNWRTEADRLLAAARNKD